MKLFVLCALALIGFVASETCKAVGDCTVTQCGTGYTLICVNDECTCSVSTGHGCTTSSDCHEHCNNNNNHHHPGGPHHGGTAHCVDGQCRCV